MSERLRAIAADTMEILGRGWYVNPAGERVDLAGALSAAQVHPPREELSIPRGQYQTTVEVVEGTTIDAVLHKAGERAVLNFASARRPGGGFLNGAGAQEESLARSSSLYSSLLTARPFYSFHRSHKSRLYSDHIVHSTPAHGFP